MTKPTRKSIQLLVEVATCDVAKAFDAKGRLLPIRRMPLAVRRSISAIEIDSKGAWRIKFAKERALAAIVEYLDQLGGSTR